MFIIPFVHSSVFINKNTVNDTVYSHCKSWFILFTLFAYGPHEQTKLMEIVYTQLAFYFNTYATVNGPTGLLSDQ